MRAFGPVPSRRLGRSLGINNIPAKVCPYSCVYCQVGRTRRLRIGREAFQVPEELVAEVFAHIARARAHGESIDYLTFVADGEPTLDAHLGREVALLKPAAIRIAVLTNGSLLWRPDVRNDLMQADWVSLKVDAVVEEAWRRINRPHRRLELATILEGMREFARCFPGELVTETMLVRGVNDGDAHLEAVADFLATLRPAKAYLANPTRPPAEPWVQPPEGAVMAAATKILRGRLGQVICMTEEGGQAFASTGRVAEDLLGITAVHPMAEEAVEAFLAKSGSDWAVVQSLIEAGQLVQVAYGGRRYYRRALAARSP
jgi:wyosine [tRNA(Phe)-imidazoG37] synthetase (radical SAM superfamily)